MSRIFNPDFINNLITWLTTSGVRVVVVVMGAYVLLKLFSILIGRVEKMIVKKDKGEFFATLETEKRVKTLGSILRKGTFVALFIIALMMVLKEVGMDIVPIITGAGIVGLAVGFGAQNLVRDIISGFFLIMENQVRVGDVAIINGKGGLVEAIRLRTVVLRGLDGTVHIIPNGHITELSNMTKDFSFALLDVGVAYKEDTDRVVEVLKEVGTELQNDPGYSQNILGPLEVLGVDKFDDSAVIIKVRMKTVPIQQWAVGRELRRRIKKAFDQRGIEIPFPHVSVYFGEASKPFAVQVAEEVARRQSAPAPPPP